MVHTLHTISWSLTAIDRAQIKCRLDKYYEDPAPSILIKKKYFLIIPIVVPARVRLNESERERWSHRQVTWISGFEFEYSLGYEKTSDNWPQTQRVSAQEEKFRNHFTTMDESWIHFNTSKYLLGFSGQNGAKVGRDENVS